MDIQVSLYDLLVFLTWVLGISIGIFLIIVLKDLHKTIKGINSIVSVSKDKVNDSLDKLPDIMENIDSISATAKVTGDKLKKSIPEIAEDTRSITHSVKITTDTVENTIDQLSVNISEAVSVIKDNTNNLVTYYRIIGEVIRTFYKLTARK